MKTQHQNMTGLFQAVGLRGGDADGSGQSQPRMPPRKWQEAEVQAATAGPGLTVMMEKMPTRAPVKMMGRKICAGACRRSVQRLGDVVVAG